MDSININTQIDGTLTEITKALKDSEFYLENGDVFKGADLSIDWLTELDLNLLSKDDIVDLVVEQVSNQNAYCVDSHSLFI